LTKIRIQNRCSKRHGERREKDVLARGRYSERERALRDCSREQAVCRSVTNTQQQKRRGEIRLDAPTDWTAYVWSASGYSLAINAGLSPSMEIHAVDGSAFQYDEWALVDPDKNMTDPAQVGGHKRSASSIVARTWGVSELSRRVLSQRSYQFGRPGLGLSGVLVRRPL